MQMKKSNIYIGEIIKNVMSERQVTKAELARRLDVKPQSVDYLLTRHRHGYIIQYFNSARL